MPVSRGLPLIVVYALYYAILLYALSSVGCSICTELSVHLYRRMRLPVDIHIHITICICEDARIMYGVHTGSYKLRASKYECYHLRG